VYRFERVGNCKAVLPGCMVGSRQAEHESHRESMEEDDMVMRVGNSLVLRRTDEEGRAASPRCLTCLTPKRDTVYP